MSVGSPEGNELGAFLRSRRERADPDAAGVVSHTRRRVAGLRREELAMLAGLSASYYARLEQGRDRHPSPEVLAALARVLQLSDADRRYLHDLTAPAPVGTAETPADTVRPGVQHLLRRWTDLPAFVVTPRRDVVAATDLAGRVNPAWVPGANLAEFVFLDPRATQTYPDRDVIAAQTVAGLRASAATHPDEVQGFVADMRRRSDWFRKLWDRHDVVDRTLGHKDLGVPGAGTVRLHYETFVVAGNTGQQLFVYFPLADADRAALERLA